MLLLTCLIGLLVLPLASGAKIIDPVLKTDNDYSANKFKTLDITNPESKNSRQMIMESFEISSLEEFPIAINGRFQSPLFSIPVTSPNGIYRLEKQHIYKNDTVIAKGFTSYDFMPYQAVFSPDGRMMVKPYFFKTTDAQVNIHETLGFSIVDTEDQNTIAEHDLGISREDVDKQAYLNSIVQIYWSADGKSIIVDTVYGEKGHNAPAPTFKYIKCDIDYNGLLMTRPDRGFQDDTPSIPGFTGLPVIIALSLIMVFHTKRRR